MAFPGEGFSSGAALGHGLGGAPQVPLGTSDLHAALGAKVDAFADAMAAIQDEVRTMKLGTTGGAAMAAIERLQNKIIRIKGGRDGPNDKSAKDLRDLSKRTDLPACTGVDTHR